MMKITKLLKKKVCCRITWLGLIRFSQIFFHFKTVLKSKDISCVLDFMDSTYISLVNFEFYIDIHQQYMTYQITH